MQIVDPYDGFEQDFDLLFLDTEFSRLPFPAESSTEWSQRVEILSAGVVAANQAIEPSEFYAVRQMTKRLEGKCSSFVIREVLPLLHRAEPGRSFAGMPQLKRALAEFLKQRSARAPHQAALLVDWAGDLALMQQALPSAVIGISLEGMVGLDEPAMSSGLLRHHALHDARLLRRQFQRLR